MSQLLSVLYEVAEIRSGCQRVHDERFGLSPRRIMRVITRRPLEPAVQCAELAQLKQRLEHADRRLQHLDAEDLSIRRGAEIQATLRAYVDALRASLSGLERLCRHEHAKPTLPAGDDSAPLKVAYDDALQQQKRLAGRLNALIATL